MDDTTGGRFLKCEPKHKKKKDTCEPDGKIKSKLGGASDGPSLCGVDPTANRVDRLRLLGNGVVPNTCERAIRILLERLHSE